MMMYIVLYLARRCCFDWTKKINYWQKLCQILFNPSRTPVYSIFSKNCSFPLPHPALLSPDPPWHLDFFYFLSKTQWRWHINTFNSFSSILSSVLFFSFLNIFLFTFSEQIRKREWGILKCTKQKVSIFTILLYEAN